MQHSNKKDKSFLRLKISFIALLTISVILWYELIFLNSLNKKIENNNNQIEIILNNENMDSKEVKLKLLNETIKLYLSNDLTIDEHIVQIETKSNKIIDENTEIEQAIEKQSAQMKTLQKLNNELNTLYQDLTFHKIEGVITYNQYPKYPNGCEAIALYILLKYYNISVTPEKVMDSLPKGEIPYYKNNVLYGGNPNYEFLGDPRKLNSWGIWDKGLVLTANKIKSGIKNGTGMEFEEVLNLVKKDRPVIVWTTINLIDPYISTSWIYKETGEKIEWKAGNHAVVVIGYTEDKIIVSDPINGKIRKMNKKKFVDIYNYMGKKAIYY